MSRRELSSTEPRAVAERDQGVLSLGVELTKCQTKVCPFPLAIARGSVIFAHYLLIGFLCEAGSDAAIWSRLPVRCQTWA